MAPKKSKNALETIIINVQGTQCFTSLMFEPFLSCAGTSFPPKVNGTVFYQAITLVLFQAAEFRFRPGSSGKTDGNAAKPSSIAVFSYFLLSGVRTL